MEYDVHTLLDLATLTTTIWVIYMMRFNLNSSCMLEKDNVSVLYVVIPCALLSLVVHPTTQHYIVNRVVWAFCVCLESVSVLPQLRVMQNTKFFDHCGTINHASAPRKLLSEVQPPFVPRESMHMKSKYEDNDTNNNNGKMSQKSGPIHVYICCFIMGLQLTIPQNQYSLCFDGHLSSPIIEHRHSPWSTKILSNPYQYSGFCQTWQNQ